MELFNTLSIAKGYADKRPYFHPLVIQKIKSFLKLSRKLETALDVGCGAGMSTIALLEIAESVIGIDSSPNMIASAISKKGIQYFNYPAEALPFKHKFDIVTLAGSINWIDRTKFFPEVRRITAPGNFVVIYDNNILGIMREDERFVKWYHQQFLEKYPKPPRNESSIQKQEAVEYGFEFVHSEDYSNWVQFDLEDFIKYLFTQSNITAVLNDNSGQSTDIRKWLERSLVPHFSSNTRTIKFGGYIWYLKRL